MFKNLKLGIKLNIILVVIFLSTIISCGSVLSHVLEKKVEREVSEKTFLAIETMNSIRNYTSDRIQPRLAPQLATETN